MTLNIRKFLLVLVLLFTSSVTFALTADFTEDYVAGCSPLVVHFTNTSTGASSYYWDLGNGTTSTLTDVSGSYITPGTYTVVLTSYSGSSSTTHTVTITVYPSPTVSFYATDTSICPGTATTFVSTSTLGVSGGATYYWNFGDGSNSTAASPSHAYTTSGYYNITLTVTNSMGCATTLTIPSYIHVFTRPSVSFSGTPSYFCHPPGHVVFTNTSTGSGGLTYLWSFGDGGTSTSASPSYDYTSTGSFTVRLVVTDANGCVDSMVRPGYIFIGTSAASFTYSSTLCTSGAITFINTSTTHTFSSWNFGDGGGGTGDTIAHTYGSPGTYNVRLVVYNGHCYDTIIHTITVLPAPTGSFTMSPTAPCPAPATISFTGTVPSGSTVTWLFGDGSSGSGASTTHTYTTNGADSVRMIITDANGCIDTVVQVNTILDLFLHASPSQWSGCVPLTVTFTPIVTSTPSWATTYPYAVSTYSWSFGDGTTSTSTSAVPTHTYTAVGIYTVLVTIVTVNGCVAHDTEIIKVGAPPVVTFTASPRRVCYGDSVHFTVTVVSGPVDNFIWNWMDGLTDNTTNLTIWHRFMYPGTFVDTLIAYYHGCPSTAVYDTIIVDSPMARIMDSFLCSPYNSVKFFDTSYGDDTHVWIFGDGTYSTLDNPVHTFPSLSVYTVRLATYSAHSGCRDTAIETVNLVPPVLSIGASDSAVCEDAVITFTPTVTGGTPSHFYWSVNGLLLDNDTGRVFTDTFRVRGLYTIKLVIQDQNKCLDTFERPNWVIVGKPIDSFDASPVVGCWPLVVTFTDHSTDITGTSLTNYKWTFGDGATATVGTSPITHTYTAAGTYNVTEVVTDNIGCMDTAVRTSLITVWRPHAVFSVSTNYPCIGSIAHFNNTSSGITGSFWMFGDGDTSSTTSPDHIYRTVGTYTVKLVVIDAHGCRDTAVYAGYISVTSPHAAFYMDDSFSICPPMPVHFTNSSTGATTYAWDFGDGATSVLTNPNDLYTVSGLYHIRLIATNSHGCKDTAYHDATLYGYAGAFSYSPLSGCSPLLVHFHANLSNVPHIIWDFADGTTTAASYSDTTSHYYILPGAYVPKLVLSDNTGCQNSSLGIDTIKVDGIKPGFTTIPNPVCVNTDLHLNDTSKSLFSTITSWHWLFTNGDTSNISSPLYHYSVTGTYAVKLNVVDGWGCSDSVTQNIVVNPPPVVWTSKDTTVCKGDPATLTGFGGVSYSWAPSATVGCTTCQTTTATPPAVTTYTVTVTDSNGCINSDTVSVYLRYYTISKGWGDTEVCRNVYVQLNDTGATKYSWTPAYSLDNPNIANPIAIPDITTTYTVVAQLGSCIPDTNYVTVIVHQPPTVNAGPDQRVGVGTPVQLQASGTFVSSYSWEPAANLSCGSCSNPIAHIHTTTMFTVFVTSAFGCHASDSVKVTMFCDKDQIFLPNSFTPNNDGKNDVFYPRGAGLSKIKTFRIFNRWGELLFEKLNFDPNDAASGWDGSYLGEKPRPDVYVYLVDAVCESGEPLFVKGDVTIIR